MSTLVHSRGEGVKIGQNLVHVVVECPLSLPNAYKLMSFDRNINGNKDEKILDGDYCVLGNAG